MLSQAGRHGSVLLLDKLTSHRAVAVCTVATVEAQMAQLLDNPPHIMPYQSVQWPQSSEPALVLRSMTASTQFCTHP